MRCSTDIIEKEVHFFRTSVEQCHQDIAVLSVVTKREREREMSEVSKSSVDTRNEFW